MMKTVHAAHGRRALRLLLASALVGGVGAVGLATPASAADEPDTTPPSTMGATATPPVLGTIGALWFNGPATLQLWAGDPSGVTLSYEVHEGGATAPSVTVSDAASVLAYPEVSAEGEGWVSYRAIDGAGNVSPEQRIDFVIDTTAPIIAVTPPTLADGSAQLVQGAAIALSLECLDTHACLWRMADGSDAPATVPAGELGDHELAVHTEDVFGNTREVVLRYTVLAAESDDPAGPTDPADDPADDVDDPDDPDAPRGPEPVDPSPLGDPAPALQPVAAHAPLLAETGVDDSAPVAGMAVLTALLGGALVAAGARVSRRAAASR